ncbi:XRE family transcriptional regulator [Pontibacter chinhatensis]|uniref:Helix-turn-helix n=1 Tax=Pontibacter chinhatensis TaxID=1436961 RepID=A0A1I2ZMK7_9BACT|nr:helix-turn-helix transcriptional regulator [Pontibacter chinhatensis]SFH39063.1 Helix-turn-helix [Pontibacter chinhatensis]
MESEDKILNEVYSILGKDGVTTLSELVNSKCEELQLSQRQFSAIVGIERKSLNRIFEGEAQKVDIVTLLKLSHFLKKPIDDVIRIYIYSLTPETLSDVERTKRASFIVENFDLTGMKKAGVLDDISDFELIEKRINTFFGLETIFEYKDRLDYALFSRTRKSTRDTMRDFWVKSAYTHFEKLDNPNPYDRKGLVSIISKIKPYSELDTKGFITVVKALYNLGITVIAQANLPNVQVRGATFVVKGKPCIVLTDLIKNYGTIWFCLLHELYHVLYDLDKLTDTCFHLSEDQLDLQLTEEKANSFAREMLFGKDQLEYIRPFISNHSLVSRYAKQNAVHPSIIYSFYAWDKLLEGDSSFFMKFNKSNLLPPADPCLNQVKLSTWNVEELEAQLKNVRSVFV